MNSQPNDADSSKRNFPKGESRALVLSRALESYRTNLQLLSAKSTKLALARRQQHRLNEALALLVMGDAARCLGEPALARSFTQDASEIARSLKMQELEARALFQMGRIALSDEEPEQALAFFEQAERYAVACGDQEAQCYIQSALGEIALQQGNFRAAFDHLTQAHTLSPIVSASSRFTISGLLANACAALGELPSAIRYTLEASEYAPLPEARGVMYAQLGEFHSMLKDYVMAAVFFQRAFDLWALVPSRAELSKEIGAASRTIQATRELSERLKVPSWAKKLSKKTVVAIEPLSLQDAIALLEQVELKRGETRVDSNEDFINELKSMFKTDEFLRDGQVDIASYTAKLRQQIEKHGETVARNVGSHQNPASKSRWN